MTRQVDGHGDTALLHASRGGHLEAARLLLERGALVDAQTRAGWASMHCAAQGDELEVRTVPNPGALCYWTFVCFCHLT